MQQSRRIIDVSQGSWKNIQTLAPQQVSVQKQPPKHSQVQQPVQYHNPTVSQQQPVKHYAPQQKKPQSQPVKQATTTVSPHQKKQHPDPSLKNFDLTNCSTIDEAYEQNRHLIKIRFE